jgi:N utilization substance protein A
MLKSGFAPTFLLVVVLWRYTEAMPRGGFLHLKNDFLVAIAQISAERHLSKEVVLETIEEALLLAYKHNFGAAQNLEVKIDPNTGKARVYAEKQIVEQVEDQRTQVSLKEARKIDDTAEAGTMIRIEMTPKTFGRIAAQTAKQVILQRIREAERETMYADWSDRLGELVLGKVRNVDSSGNVILSLGRAEAIMPRNEQIPTEQYGPGQKLRTYVYEVEKTNRGPRIRVSRTHRKLLRRLLESEVPEIYNGVVEIKAIAREPGSRSKVAVAATQDGVDPVGSCVGMRGVRVQNIVNELNGEKTDIVAWAPEEERFVANALSPAKVEHVWLDPKTKTATVVVPDHQLSLAIGKEGQNARLAAKLTNWRIDIKNATEAAGEAERRAKEAAEAAAREAKWLAKRDAARALLAEAELSLAEEEDQEVAIPVETAPAVEEVRAEEAVLAAEPTVAEEQPAPPVQVQPEMETPLEAAEPPAETPAEAQEQVTEAVVEAAVSEEEQPTWEIDEEEEGAAEPVKKKPTRRRRDLVYDPETGEVISQKRRKSSRQTRDWQEETEW